MLVLKMYGIVSITLLSIESVEIMMFYVVDFSHV